VLHGGEDTSDLQMLVAGPNLTIDRTALLAELRPGEVLRFDRVVVTPGGKGLNVARAARALGHSALLVALLPGHTGRAVAALIGEEGIELSGVPCGGELRSTMIVQERGGRTTVMNEPGPPVDERRWADYENAVRGRLTSRSVLVCSGSVPPGAPADAYGRLTEIARAAAARAVVDAAGTTLLRALDAAPDLVTPNLAEAEGSLGLGSGGASVASGADARPRALDAAEALLRQGARAAVVTADAAGAAVASDAGAEWIPAPRVAEVRNPIGAGDVLLSALAGAWETPGSELTAAARWGVAAAAASVEHPTAGELDPARARVLAGMMARGGA
jgi:1-phosphofructokinase family hexose kinase